MNGIRIIRRIFPKKRYRTEEDYLLNSCYSPVPYTLMLHKRKYEEEQFSKYGIHKEKICDIS